MVTYACSLHMCEMIVPPLKCFGQQEDGSTGNNSSHSHSSIGARSSLVGNHDLRTNGNDSGLKKQPKAANHGARACAIGRAVTTPLTALTSKEWTAIGYDKAVPVLFLTFMCVGFNACVTIPWLMQHIWLL